MLAEFRHAVADAAHFLFDWSSHACFIFASNFFSVRLSPFLEVLLGVHGFMYTGCVRGQTQRMPLTNDLAARPRVPRACDSDYVPVARKLCLIRFLAVTDHLRSRLLCAWAKYVLMRG